LNVSRWIRKGYRSQTPMNPYLLDEQQVIDILIAKGEHPPYQGPLTRREAQWRECPVDPGSSGEQCEVTILDTETGEKVTARDTPFHWLENNGKCDCERAREFGRRGRIPCGDYRYRIVAVNGVEWEEPR